MLSVLSFASVTVGVAAPPTFHRVANGSMNANTPPAVLDTFKTRDGRTVSVLERGFVVVQDSKKRTQTVRYAGGLIGNSRAPIAPSHQAVMRALSKPVSAQPYLPGTVVVVLNAGSALSKDDVRPYARALAEMHRSLAVSSRNSQTASAPAQTMVYPYSNDAALNRVLSRFAVADAHRLFASTAGTRVAAMRSRARSASSLLPVENAYLLTITNGTVRDAVVALRKLPSVAYASPNFRVATMTAPPVAIPAGRVQFAKTQSMRFRMQLPARRTMGASIRQSSIPGNYDVAYSGQSMLNASGVNAIAAYDEITSAFGQLPGAGEIITNVSIGDLDDPSAAANQADPCYNYLNDYNVPTTTEVIGGQRYLSLPSMPLIPTYTADTSGNTNPLGEVCGAGDDGEIDLDFSVMAPLPHNLQRPDAQGSGFSDLLGIAPGAQFRLVVPQNPNVGATDIAGALLGAALQQPAPNVITASLGWGADGYGFPSRYLEEDPLIRSVISSIVAQGIVVCISSGDGLRTFTNAAVNASGGTVPINVVTSGGTDLNDDVLSTIPSAVIDSGSIAVGGTTLDDVTAAPPYETQFAQYRDQLAFPEVRWSGFGNFASGYGPRVNISAPSDNILVTDMRGNVNLSGGTSASAPEVAAAAAVALQVARLTGKPFSSATAVRDFLVKSADPVPNVPQADQQVSVGPQLDVAHAVETLLGQGNVRVQPSVTRVAVAQRQPIYASDFAFVSDTDPASLDLTGARDDTYAETGYTLYQPITIAPDWEALPANAQFKLYVSGSPAKVLGTNRFARLYPTDLLNAAGLPLSSTQQRTVNLTYVATAGLHAVAETSIALTFLPNTSELHGMGPAPSVAPVTTGNYMIVKYDISNVDLSFDRNPTLLVSVPGRTSSAEPGYHTLYQVPLTQPQGTVQVPISALQGDGIYGVAVGFHSQHYSDSTTWAYTRVANAGSARPAAPLVSLPGTSNTGGHYIDVPLGSPVQVSWDVSKVPGAIGAILEVSAPGPTGYGNYNTFNNPNGSIVDHNGMDSGSQYTTQVGTSGTTTILPSQIASGEYQAVRVIPVGVNGPAGEASDESTIATHGIATADGGNLYGGFAINSSGTDGILTSNQIIGLPGNATMVVSSLEAFDQKANAIGAFMANNEESFSYWSTGGVFDDFFNVWDLGIDPATDSAYFWTPISYSENCTPLCTGFSYHGQINWLPQVNQYALGQASDAVNGQALPLPVPQPSPASSTQNVNTGVTGGWLLQSDPKRPQWTNAPTLSQLLTSNQFTAPALGTSFPFNSLLQDNVAGISTSGGYTAALAWDGNTYQNVIDVMQNSTGTEQLAPLDPNSDMYNYSVSLVMDGGEVYFLSCGCSYWTGYNGSVSGYGAAPYVGGTIPPRTLNSVFPVAISTLGNGWVAVISIWGADWRTNDNVLSAVEVMNPQSGADYVMESSYFIGVSQYTGTSNGEPPFNNLLQANPNTKTIYVVGPSGTEIQVIPVSKLGVNL